MGNLQNKNGPFLLAVGGLSGTGKSTLCRALLKSLMYQGPVTWISNDRVRKELWGVPPTFKLPPEAYNSEFNQKVNDEVNMRIISALSRGHFVIADGLFNGEGRRAELESIASEGGIPFLGIWLEAELEEKIKRADSRVGTGDASDADSDFVRKQHSFFKTGHVAWWRMDTTFLREKDVYTRAAGLLEDCGVSFGGPPRRRPPFSPPSP